MSKGNPCVRIIGEDPGLHGAYAMYDGTQLFIFEVPVVDAKKGSEVDYAALTDTFDVCLSCADHAYIEKVGSMPKQGLASTFKFGYIAGAMRMLVQSAHIPITEVTPMMWKPAMGVTAVKHSSVKRASELFPKYQHLFHGPKGGEKDGPAEAALIAYYGYKRMTGIGDARIKI